MKFYVFQEWHDFDNGGMNMHVFDTHAELKAYLETMELGEESTENLPIIIQGQELKPIVKTKMVKHLSIEPQLEVAKGMGVAEDTPTRRVDLPKK